MHAQERYTVGGSGGMVPQKILGAMRLLLRPILGQYDASRRSTTEFHTNVILPIALYTNGVGFPIQFAYRPKATPFAGEACETNRSLVRMESCWKTIAEQFCCTVCSHLARFNIVPMCFGALRGRPHRNARHRASHE